MKILKWIVVGLILCWTATPGWAEISPISLSLFGLYGSPVYPPVLSNVSANAFGFNILGEWQATSYTSVGLSFEQTTFYPAPGFTVPTLNLEARVFPFENEKKSFSPYVYGGAGLDLEAGSSGAIQLKAGLGSRIRFVGPLFFDFAVGSHWVQPPASFQYVDFRAGLGLSIGFKEPTGSSTAPNQQASQPTPLPTLAPVLTPAMTPTVVASPNPNWTPVPTPVFDSAPVTSVAEAKMYYKIGNDAFKAGNYPLALKAYKKSLSLKEKHKALYYYAETYAQIGVIYQFHAMKVKDHDKKALSYYKKALAIDPKTKSARKFYKKLKAKVAKEGAKKKKGKKAKPKATPTPADSTVGTTSTSDITLSTGSTSDNVPADKPAPKSY